MRKALAACMVAAALVALPSGARAAGLPAPAKTASAKKASKASLGTHSTRGVVKSIDATTLVVSRPGKHAKDMTFVIQSETRKQGTIDVGAPVSVRYREDGSSHVATAITARHPAKG